MHFYIRCKGLLINHLFLSFNARNQLQFMDFILFLRMISFMNGNHVSENCKDFKTATCFTPWYLIVFVYFSPSSLIVFVCFSKAFSSEERINLAYFVILLWSVDYCIHICEIFIFIDFTWWQSRSWNFSITIILHFIIINFRD